MRVPGIHRSNSRGVVASGSRARPARAASGGRRRRRTARAVGIALLVVAAGLLALTEWLEEPLRRNVEQAMNQRLRGYQVRIGELDLDPLQLAVSFGDLRVRQDQRPEPAVLDLPRLRASVHWSALLGGALVADFELEAPTVHLERGNVERERDDEVPVGERGWQHAVQAMYPLEINELIVRDGRFTYVDPGPFEPLVLSEIDAVASNIRNVRHPAEPYPSRLRVRARVFDGGRLEAEGRADFLAVPHPGTRGRVKLDDVALAYFQPLIAPYGLRVAGGQLDGEIDLEYAPHGRSVRIRDVAIRELEAEYVHDESITPRSAQRIERVARRVRERAQDARLAVQLDRLRVVSGRLGYVNRTTEPDYELFVQPARVELRNLSSGLDAGEARASIRGPLMGAGEASASGVFRPKDRGADFDLAVEIVDAPLPRVNDLLRAYGGIDVRAGRFSLYSELRVRGREVDGYVKPLFRDLDVYDLPQDAGQSPFQQLYEGVIGGLGAVLENSPRDEVATRAELSGTLENPDASSWQIAFHLVQNALFGSILPGFDRELRNVRG